ncbi:hypothetical protein D6833_05610, partial [Candidatus Parcubacteria bacterium]
VKIVDFGLAKLAGATMVTKEGTTLGTVAYMSPEQAQGAEVDQRTDIWALGAVIYEMTAGKQPFAGDYEQAVVYSIMNEDPEPPTALRTGVPMELERIVNKCLAKSPEERYQRTEDLLVDLHALSKNMPSATVKSRPVATAKARSSMRNRFLIVGCIVGLLLVLALGFAYFFRTDNTAIDSLAILPMINGSSDPEMEYLSDGLSENLINNLASLPDLKVMSYTSVLRYKGGESDLRAVGKALNVRAVLTGRVVQRGDQLTINVELVDTRDDRHLWGEQYRRKLNDIVVVQEAIARDITEKLRLELSAADRSRLTKRATDNPAAYQLYLKGRYYASKFTKKGFQKGIDYINQ